MIYYYNKFCGLFVYHLSNVALISASFRRKKNLIIDQIQFCLDANTNYIIPENLASLIISVEDRRFEQHYGVDFYSILRAIYRTVLFNRIEGASTISQQLVRTITNEREITFRRKVREIFLTIRLNKYFTKKQLFHAYFNLYQINNCVGIPHFCSKIKFDLNKLSKNECCHIVARLKYPIITDRNEVRFTKRMEIIESKYNSNAM